MTETPQGNMEKLPRELIHPPGGLWEALHVCRMPGQQAGAAARELQNTICKTATGYSTSERMR
jgi:hypothetical protein